MSSCNTSYKILHVCHSLWELLSDTLFPYIHWFEMDIFMNEIHFIEFLLFSLMYACYICVYSCVCTQVGDVPVFAFLFKAGITGSCQAYMVYEDPLSGPSMKSSPHTPFQFLNMPCILNWNPEKDGNFMLLFAAFKRNTPATQYPECLLNVMYLVKL